MTVNAPDKSANSGAERRARLDKALRENLKKRKQQQRARSQTEMAAQKPDAKKPEDRKLMLKKRSMKAEYGQS